MASLLGRMNIRITKYGNRNWAVWTGDDLLAVTVYKKGARAIRDLLVRHGLGTTAEDGGKNRPLKECSCEHTNRATARALQLSGAA